MSQLTCIACQLPIYRGQRAISLEFGQIEQSQKSQRDVIKAYATDTIHFGCIQEYLGRIDGELYDSIMTHHKQVIRKQVIEEYRDELKQEIYDEVVDDIGHTCAICQGELETAMEEDEDIEDTPIAQTAVEQGPPPTPSWLNNPLPPSPFAIPLPNGHK